MNINQEQVSFIWWNTSLSHRLKFNLEEESRVVVWGIINYFTQCLEADVIVLTEVCENDISDIKKYCCLEGFSIISACKPVGHTHFDFCVIYKSAKICILNYVAIDASKVDQTYKIGYRFDIKVVDFPEILHCFISHWPSRARPDTDKKREFIADRLRLRIEGINEDYKCHNLGAPYIILMGDYNDEPFDISLADKIMATRDRNAVKKREGLFYNPFWADMHEKDGVDHLGTYYYHHGIETKWRTFDQIMYSHAFFCQTEWEMVDLENRILNLSYILSLVTSGKSKFDHLPIMGVIKRIS